MPLISVVMSTYNNETTIERTVGSILSQSLDDFELIIIEDGSSDKTLDIIRSFDDPRIQLTTQTNKGLTAALILGCSYAKGKFIARHDAGDFSHQSRLSSQLQVLEENHDTVMVSTSTKFVTPLNEQLYIVDHSKLISENTLAKTAKGRLIGPPHHGSVMFRVDDYRKVGGYRKQFKVAQDLDLWSRLLELGNHVSLEKIYYQATIEAKSISQMKRKDQLVMEDFILRCIEQRKKLGNDENVIKQLEHYNDYKDRNHLEQKVPETASYSAYNYFIGSNLLAKNPQASLRYLRKSLQYNCWQPKAFLKLCYAALLCIFRVNYD